MPTGSDCRTGTIHGITVHTKKTKKQTVNKQHEYNRQQVNIWLVRHRTGFIFENNPAQQGNNNDRT